ncbi:MAG: hypothetical protein JWM25_287 [Thermoleophilia bacterium]|nr:hypothetical protein [Thermoleophilia bacterium]
MSRIATIAHELCSNLDEQNRVWQRLLTLSQAQLEALTVGNVHAVHAILQDIEMAMLDRSRTEVRRGMLMEQAANELGVSASDVTRDLITAQCDAPIGAALAASADQLRVMAHELDLVVAKNKVLLEQELAIIDVLVQGVTVDRTATKTYAKTGSQAEAPRLRLLDAQV